MRISAYIEVELRTLGEDELRQALSEALYEFVGAAGGPHNAQLVTMKVWPKGQKEPGTKRAKGGKKQKGGMGEVMDLAEQLKGFGE